MIRRVFAKFSRDSSDFLRIIIDKDKSKIVFLSSLYRKTIKRRYFCLPSFIKHAYLSILHSSQQGVILIDYK
jgi:hypothetical protein